MFKTVRVQREVLERSISELQAELDGMETKRALLIKDIPEKTKALETLEAQLAEAREAYQQAKASALSVLNKARLEATKVLKEAEQKKAAARVIYKKADLAMNDVRDAERDQRALARAYEVKINNITEREHLAAKKEETLARKEAALERKTTEAREKLEKAAIELGHTKAQIDSRTKELKGLTAKYESSRKTVEAEEKLIGEAWAKIGVEKENLATHTKYQHERGLMLDEREQALDAREKELVERVISLDEKQAALATRAAELETDTQKAAETLRQSQVILGEAIYVAESVTAMTTDAIKQDKLADLKKRAEALKQK